MAREEESDRFILAPQAVRRQPGLERRHGNRLARRRSTEQFALAQRRRVMGPLRAPKYCIDRGQDSRAVLFKCVESTRASETLKYALIHRARIEAGRKVREVGKRP